MEQMPKAEAFQEIFTLMKIFFILSICAFLNGTAHY